MNVPLLSGPWFSSELGLIVLWRPSSEAGESGQKDTRKHKPKKRLLGLELALIVGSRPIQGKDLSCLAIALGPLSPFWDQCCGGSKLSHSL